MRFNLQLTPSKRATLIENLKGLIEIGVGDGDDDNALKNFLALIKFRNDFDFDQQELEFVCMCLKVHAMNLNGTIEPENGLDHELLEEISDDLQRQIAS
jgi:hypothetical protein